MRSALMLMLLLGFVACNDDEGAEMNNPNRLEVGESKTVAVDAIEFWNNASIDVEIGETYNIVSTGNWVDLNIETDADGFSDPLLDNFSHLKRVPEANWFELIAAVDSSNFYIVGSSAEINFMHSGSLSFFANDAEDFYDNNLGSISTVVTRIE